MFLHFSVTKDNIEQMVDDVNLFCDFFLFLMGEQRPIIQAVLPVERLVRDAKRSRTNRSTKSTRALAPRRKAARTCSSAGAVFSDPLQELVM